MYSSVEFLKKRIDYNKKNKHNLEKNENIIQKKRGCGCLDNKQIKPTDLSLIEKQHKLFN